MCTVTIIPTGGNDFVLTSNRDESPNRRTLFPDFYEIDTTRMLFPKDELAGGTWIGVSDKNRLICLLNGGFMLHERQDVYRMSRGVIVKDLLVTETIISSIESYNFKDVEPFTIVIADWNKELRFFELVWDGTKKHFKELPLEPKIWSSSTLYSEAMKKERLTWFEDYKSSNDLTSESALEFHKTAGSGNDDYGTVMDRGFVKTTSITQVEKLQDKVTMKFSNLEPQKTTISTFLSSEIVHE